MTESTSKATVTRLLILARDGNTRALHDVFPLVYETLYDLAQAQRRRWHGNDTINTTALLHEAFLKLVDQSQVEWQSRTHFLAVASRAMRHILINYARKQQTRKRGGDQQRIDLEVAERDDPGALIAEDRVADLLSLDEALAALGQKSERQVQVVECRFFGNMTIEETAAALDISPATVKRDWAMAQAWLYRFMHES